MCGGVETRRELESKCKEKLKEAESANQLASIESSEEVESVLW